MIDTKKTTEEKPESIEPVEKKANSFWQEKKKMIGVITLSVFVILALSGGGVAATETYHKDRIFHGVSIGGLDIGGLTMNEARNVLETWHDQWWSHQLQYRVLDEQGKLLKEIDFLPLIISEGSGQSYQFVSFDLEAMLDRAYDYGRDPSLVKRVVNQAASLVNEQAFLAIVDFNETELLEVLQLELEEFETLPQNANLVFENASSEPGITEESSGNTFNYQKAIEQTYNQLVNLELSQVELKRTPSEPAVTSTDVEQVLVQVDPLQELFPIDITYFDTRIDFARDWKVRWSDVYANVIVRLHEGSPVLGFDFSDSEDFWSPFETIVNANYVDAKFEITDDGKVEQFQPSENGYTVNREVSTENINTWIITNLQEQQEEPTPVTLAVDITEAKVPTADVNDLGIAEVLGVGYSDFSGSPANRIHNISLGADKLDGLLIEPEETFSLLSALRPFTISEGYLPELVIKGDKIEPEIGGGLCQIGSTTFRAAMKSGLPITERRNHSLVVGYYNDPRNGNPGTDATIYDPAPDFKFTNDTGNYILIKTDMNASTGDLYFTFWGTSDGREADYTEPVVHRWIGTGPTKIVETTELAPGQRKCQGAHPGAETSFTYTVKRPDGEVEEEVFKSSYRPLPTICLVGIDPDAPKEGEEGSEEGVAQEESDPSTSEASEENSPVTTEETNEPVSADSVVE